MAVSFDTYYINAENFSDATSVFTDSAMTTVAPDGTYQFNGVYRTMSSGDLGSPFFCETCCAGCSSTYIYPISSSRNEKFTVCSNIGSLTGSAIIIKFKYNSSNSQDLGFPLGLQATYNSQEYQGVTSNRFGYLPELYIGSTIVVPPSNLEGLYRLDGFSWLPMTSDFVQSADENVTIAQSDMSSITNNPDECYMLIPKTSITNTVDVEVFSPRPTSAIPSSSGAGCDITIPCPISLSSFGTSTTQTTKILACGSSLDQTAYIMRVNSSSGTPRIFDRVFSDPAGTSPLAEGYYLLNNRYLNAASRQAWMHVVGTNGVVQAVGTCSGGGYPSLTEVISSQGRTVAGLACLYQNQSGTNLPDQQYWHNGTGDAPILGDNVYSDVLGTTPLADGFYQLMREYIVIGVTGGLGEVTSIGNCT
jgi:hypothetical protein